MVLLRVWVEFDRLQMQCLNRYARLPRTFDLVERCGSVDRHSSRGRVVVYDRINVTGRIAVYRSLIHPHFKVAGQRHCIGDLNVA